MGACTLHGNTPTEYSYAKNTLLRYHALNKYLQRYIYGRDVVFYSEVRKNTLACSRVIEWSTV